MTKQILAIVIDPENRTVEVDTVNDTLEAMQKMVGGYIERVEVPSLRAGEVLWLDEEGKLKENHHFHLRDFPEILSGKAFICREVHGEDGYVNGDTEMDVAMVEELVTWLPHLDGQQLL